MAESNGFQFLRRLAEVEQSTANLRENSGAAIWVLALASRQLIEDVIRLQVAVTQVIAGNNLQVSDQSRKYLATVVGHLGELEKHLANVIEAYEPMPPHGES